MTSWKSYLKHEYFFSSALGGPIILACNLIWAQTVQRVLRQCMFKIKWISFHNPRTQTDPIFDPFCVIMCQKCRWLGGSFGGLQFAGDFDSVTGRMFPSSQFLFRTTFNLLHVEIELIENKKWLEFISKLDVLDSAIISKSSSDICFRHFYNPSCKG